MSSKRISVTLDNDLHLALKYIAIEDETSLQQMFVKAIEDKYIDRILEKQIKEN